MPISQKTGLARGKNLKEHVFPEAKSKKTKFLQAQSREGQLHAFNHTIKTTNQTKPDQKTVRDTGSPWGGVWVVGRRDPFVGLAGLPSRTFKNS